jgi:hypothetical protein
MDLNPPLQPIHTVKDFLLHLLTITVGLFIALSLEAAVESLHHRHLVRDARDNLHREITANHQQFAVDAKWIVENREQLARNIELLRDLRKGKKLDPANLGWHWQWNSFSGVAWRAARDNGAVSYMEPDLISSYSLIYLQQDYINSTALAILGEESKAGAALEAAADPSNLSALEIQTLMIKSAEIKLSLGILQTTMKSLEDMYIEESQKGAMK